MICCLFFISLIIVALAIVLPLVLCGCCASCCVGASHSSPALPMECQFTSGDKWIAPKHCKSVLITAGSTVWIPKEVEKVEQTGGGQVTCESPKTVCRSTTMPPIGCNGQAVAPSMS